MRNPATLRPAEIADIKKMAKLHVAIYAAKNSLTSDEKDSEAEALFEIMITKGYVYEAAKSLQLPLPDLKEISFVDFDHLRQWKEEKLGTGECDKANILAAVAAEYRRLKLSYESDENTEIVSDDEFGDECFESQSPLRRPREESPVTTPFVRRGEVLDNQKREDDRSSKRIRHS